MRTPEITTELFSLRIAALIIIFLPVLQLSAQSSYNDFIEALISGSKDISGFVDETELNRSKRLDIQYSEIKNKFLISFDIDEDIKLHLRQKKDTYHIEETVLAGEYSMIKMRVPAMNYERTFYFHRGKFICPTTYLTCKWQTKESKYFIFKISNPKYHNDYCVKMLDDFVDSLCTMLDVDPSRKKVLKQEKIYYIFCENEAEVESLTGLKTRGMYITAFDEIVTSYNTHYHELAHLLINFKLQTLGLYTLPFFLEGFAVAVGGRGGMSSRVVTDLGYFLEKSGYLTHDSIFTNQSFYNYDANMTYAVAGLYNLFLLNQLSPSSYLELYRKANGGLEKINTLNFATLDLPARGYETFLTEYEEHKSIKFLPKDTAKPERRSPGDFGFVPANAYYKFFVSNSAVFTPADEWYGDKGYSSKLFAEKFREDWGGFGSDRFGILVDSNRIRVFNFYTDELIASYDRNLSVESESVPFIKADGEYVFFLHRNVFRNELDHGFMIRVAR
jgi:hypothetical protein